MPVALQGELDIVLDLINLMEAQKYLGVANVALSSNIQQKQQQQAIRLQQKVSKLKVRLTTTSAGPSVQLASKYC